MFLVGRASLFATPIERGTQQGAAGERGIAGPEDEILLVMAAMFIACFAISSLPGLARGLFDATARQIWNFRPLSG